MNKILFAWTGTADFRASENEKQFGLGPIGKAVSELEFTDVVLLNDHLPEKLPGYLGWLESKTSATIVFYQKKLSSPTNYSEIYQTALRIVTEVRKKHDENVHLTFHLSPGTWAMASVWIMLSKTKFKADLIESSIEAGIKKVKVPFDISAEFIPEIFRESDEKLQSISAGEIPKTVEFNTIIHRSPQMRDLLNIARRVALRKIPVLIEGESGTGKELLAKAIHQASPRRSQEIITVNCGAIPSELVESELFGHIKGSFTGAIADKKGCFEVADGGTIFLDEISELPLLAQVKLLRVLQENEVIPVGSSKVKKIDVRIISATNRSLIKEIAKGNFREDLFYRLAVFILQIPPLREREGDLTLLIDAFWKQINEQSVVEFGVEEKILKPSAKNLLLKHNWIGNVRELHNTLWRLSVLAERTDITDKDVKIALFQTVSGKSDNVLYRNFDANFNLDSVLAEVQIHYIQRAIEKTNGNKSKAAKLLGFANYQTLDNKLEKFGIKSEE